MHKIVVALALVLTGLGLAANGASGNQATTTKISASSCSYASVQPDLYRKGALTVATDSPAYTPWFVNNTPSNGKGYESAVAYAVARQLGFTPSRVRWTVEPFGSSYAPGPKRFDFDINEISYTAQRATEVTFSISYYAVQQALVALKSSPIVKHHTPAELRTYVYGDSIGSTNLSYIEDYLRPTQQPQVFNTLNDVKSALQDDRIQALVADTPTAQYISSSEIPNSVLVGQFPSTGEHYGLLFAKGDPLVRCVNAALRTLSSNGTLSRLRHKWLGIYNSVPTIKP